MKHLSGKIKILIKLFISSLIFFFLFQNYQISINKISDSHISQPIWILLALLITVTINPLLNYSRWKVFLYYAGIKERLFSLIKIGFTASFYGLVLPSSVGMDFVRIILIERKYPNHIGKTGSTVIAERILGFFVLSLIGTTGAIYIERSIKLNNLSILMALISLTLFILIVVISQSSVFNLMKIILTKIAEWTKIGFVSKIFDYLKHLYESLHHLPLMKCVSRAIPFMIGFQLSNIVVGCFLFNAFGVKLDFYIHLALLPVIQIITIIPVSISGFGLREGAFVYFYSLIGVPAEISLAVSILYFLVTAAAAAVVGGVVVIFSTQKIGPVDFQV